MSPKYPSLAFTAKDVQDLLIELQPYCTKVKVKVELAPTAADPARLHVHACAGRRGFEIGTAPTVWAEKYIPSTQQASVDRALFDVLWAMLQEFAVPSETWGRYTELAPGFPRHR